MEPVLQPVRNSFRALATTIVPEAAELDEDGWAELERIVETALAERPPALRRQLRLLIRMLHLRPILRYGRTFTALDPERRTRFLREIENSRLLLLRRGFWGLRTLVYMGYYARPAAMEVIGYRAHPRGWEVPMSQPTNAAGEFDGHAPRAAWNALTAHPDPPASPDMEESP